MSRCLPGFNPPPARGPGATREQAWGEVRGLNVSIPAPLVSGARLYVTFGTGWPCMCFNPRPARERGATPWATSSSPPSTPAFQSPPRS